MAGDSTDSLSGIASKDLVRLLTLYKWWPGGLLGELLDLFYETFIELLFKSSVDYPLVNF